jgi:hypothetical protein
MQLEISGPSFLSAEDTATQKARRERRRALIFPREHGAWGLLLVPMVTGAGVAFRESTHILPVLLPLLAALALFWLRTPVESLLGTSAMRAQTSHERRLVAIVIAGLVTVAGLALGTLLGAGRNPLLWLIGVASVIALVGQSWLKLMGRTAASAAHPGRSPVPPGQTVHAPISHAL